MDYIDIRISNKTWLSTPKERLMISRGFLTSVFLDNGLKIPRKGLISYFGPW
jgi:hypothetical protein